MNEVTVIALRRMKEAGEKIAMLTAYDFSFARAFDQAGIDVVLVGDSLGMVVQGHSSTLPVTLDEMIYHTAAVARGARRSLIISDLPFLSYQEGPVQALRSGGRLLKEAGAQMIKLEGGGEVLETVAFLTARGIPVCGHLGLTPQSVHQLSGYRVQGRGEEAAERLRNAALGLQDAGAALLVLEAVPQQLAGDITASLTIPTIGIGAGPNCDGQVLVMHDMLGLQGDPAPRFVHDFLITSNGIADAAGAYAEAVKSGRYPEPRHCYD